MLLDRIVYRHRTVETLGKMLCAGTITPEMHDAANDFQAAFIVANLEPIRALPILRVRGTGRERQLDERQLDARQRVHEALETPGGISSPARAVRLACGGPAAQRARVGHPAGWAGGRCGRSRRLVAALGVLATHFRHPREYVASA